MNMLPPTLNNGSVVLAPFLPADVTDRYVSWLSDREVTRFTEITSPPDSKQEAALYVETQIQSDNVFFWRILLDDEHVGNLRAAGLSGPHSRASIALIIGERSARGKNVGSTAIAMATEHLFSLGVHKVTAGMYALNQASKAAFLKAGYHVEAVLEDHFVVDGQFTDGVLVACFNRQRA